jgi:hypothetical protein
MMLLSKLPFAPTFRAVFLASTLSCAALDGTWGDDAEVGTIAFNLKMPGDMASADLDFTVAGVGSFEKTGTIPFSAGTRTFSATIAGIPVGKGYQLNLASTSKDAAMSCSGTATFDIVFAKFTVDVPVKLQCHLARHAAGAGGDGAAGSAGSAGAAGSAGSDGGTGGDGDIDVDGDINLCPVIDGLYVWRESTGNYELSSSACDDDSMPAPLTYKWSVSKGTLSETSQPIVTFTCPDSCGTIEVTLEVSDSECSDKWVEEFDCDDKTVGPAKHRHSDH